MPDEITIYRTGETDPVATIQPDDNSVQEKRMMGVNEIRLSFVQNKSINFKINDYTDVFGERYKMNLLPQVTKLSRYKWQYSVSMSSYQEDLRKVIYMFLGDDNSLKETEFSLMGTATDFVNLIIRNMERNWTGWTIGEVLPSDYVNLTFNSQTCYDALAAIAEAFGTEFWIIGQAIYLVPKRVERGFAFQHGRGKGLYTINRLNQTDVQLTTRLIVFGSDKNLPEGYNNYSQHLLMPDSVRYIEQNTAIYGVIEGVKTFDDVYPHRTGIVSGVDSTNVYKFTDGGLDFDVNGVLLPGLTAKITFNTGQLTGYTFDIKSFDNSTKTFEILKNKNEANIDVPSGLLKPAIGDTYVLTDISMPLSYVLYAEQVLQATAELYLSKISSPQISYQVEIDPLFMKNRLLHVDIGDAVFIVDDDMGVNRKITVVDILRKIVKEWEYTITLADRVDRNPLEDVINLAYQNRISMRDLIKKNRNNAYLNGNLIGSPRATGFDVADSSAGLTPVYFDPDKQKIVFVHP